MKLIDTIKKKNAVRVAKGETPYFVLLVFDDLGNSNITKDPDFINLYTLGRHHYFSVIFLNQYYSMLGPKIRANSLYQILFSTTGKNREELIRENLVGSFYKPKNEGDKKEIVKFRELSYLVGLLTTNLNALIIKNDNKSIYIEDIIKTYKVEKFH